MFEFVVREAVIPRLVSTDREGVIRELILSLRTSGHFQNTDIEDIVKAVMRREQLGSTGIGRTIAIPHSRHSSVTRLIGTVGISQPGIAFDAVDGEPVHVLVLLISPQDRPGDHLRALESVVQTLRDDGTVAALRAATTTDQIWQLIGGLNTPT
ncbi:MAG: PTS sugar transporter subunit IIA [Fimbriiglobus sp.]